MPASPLLRSALLPLLVLLAAPALAMDVAVPKETVKPVGISGPVSGSRGGMSVVPSVDLALTPILNAPALGAPLIQGAFFSSPLLLPAPAASLITPVVPAVLRAGQPSQSTGETPLNRELSTNLVQTKSVDNSHSGHVSAHALSVARDLNALVRTEQPQSLPVNAGPITDYAGFLKKRFPALFLKDADLTRLADDQRVQRALLDDPDALVEALLLNYRSEPADNISQSAMQEMAQVHKQLLDFISATLKDKAPQAPAVRKALETRFLYEFTHRDFGRTRQALKLISLLEPASDELLIAVLDAGIRDTFELDEENAFESAGGAFQSLGNNRLSKGKAFYQVFYERYLSLERSGRMIVFDDQVMSIDLGDEMKLLFRSLHEKENSGIEPLLVEFVSQVRDPELKVISLTLLARSEDPQRAELAVSQLRALAADPALDYGSVREAAALALLQLDSRDKVGTALLREFLVGNQADVSRKASLAAELLKGNGSDRAAMRFLLGPQARENVKAIVVAAAFFPQNKGAIARLIAEIRRRVAKPSALSELGHQINRYPAAQSVVDELMRHRDAVPEDDRAYFDQKVAELRARQIPGP
mgnify:CR=1 FL=1